MNQDGVFDDAALDRICERINGVRAFIRTLPHNGALIDVDTLLAVAHAEASRQRSRVDSAITPSGKPATPA
jgi:hypothetical protein